MLFRSLFGLLSGAELSNNRHTGIVSCTAGYTVPIYSSCAYFAYQNSSNSAFQQFFARYFAQPRQAHSALRIIVPCLGFIFIAAAFFLLHS